MRGLLRRLFGRSKGDRASGPSGHAVQPPPPRVEPPQARPAPPPPPPPPAPIPAAGPARVAEVIAPEPPASHEVPQAEGPATAEVAGLFETPAPPPGGPVAPEFGSEPEADEHHSDDPPAPGHVRLILADGTMVEPEVDEEFEKRLRYLAENVLRSHDPDRRP